MNTTIQQSIKPALAAGALAIALLLALLAPNAAHASESPYCGSWLSAKTYCYGAARTFNAEYGTGAQGSVCVGNGISGAACSGGPGQGVYKAVGEWIYAQPWIFNNMWNGENLVHGTAFTP